MGFIYAGETLIDYISHIDHSGNLRSSATFTVVRAEDPLGNSFVPRIVNEGSGTYRIEIDTPRTLPGQWYLLVGDLDLSPAKYYDASWDVDPVASEPAGDGGIAGTGRTTLRRSIGRMLGDLVVATCTANGTTSTVVDEVNLHQQDGSLSGRQLYVAFSTPGNTGQTRRVATNQKSQSTITFTPPLPNPTRAGDVVELWNERGSTVTVDEVHDAINRAIAAASGTSVAPASQDMGTFDRNSPTLTIPPAWEYFSRVRMIDRYTHIWRDIPHVDVSLDQANRTVTVKGLSRELAHGCAVRLVGHTTPGPLSSDADATPVDAEWIGYYACNQLLLSSAHRQMDPNAALSKASWFGDQADKLRPKTRIRPSGRFVRLR